MFPITHAGGPETILFSTRFANSEGCVVKVNRQTGIALDPRARSASATVSGRGDYFDRIVPRLAGKVQGGRKFLVRSGVRPVSDRVRFE